MLYIRVLLIFLVVFLTACEQSKNSQIKPVASAQSISTYQDSSVEIILEGTSAKGSITNYTILTQPDHGSVSGTPPYVTYTPELSYLGPDSFTFSVTNNKGSESAPASIDISVIENIKPVADAQSITVFLNTPQELTLTGSDADGSIASYTIIRQPAAGVLSGNIPNLIYTPNQGISGNDSFSFIVTDNIGSSSLEANIDITIDSLRSTLQGRSDGKGMDLVITGDAFTADQLTQFHTAVDNYISFMFGYNAVLGKQRNGWNIHRLDTISATSDLSGTTAFEAYYNCSGIQRLICVNTTAVYNAVAENFPQYDHVLVLVNNTEYGGSGGSLSVASLHPLSNDVALHEMGHSFAGLADEYEGTQSAPTIEPIEPNVSINNDINTVKWNYWIDIDHPETGLFEGARYATTGVWRPTNDSIMRTLGLPFYAVNQEAWSLALYESSGTHHSITPSTTNVSHINGDQIQFEIEPSIGTTSQQVDWYVNGVLSQSNSLSFQCCTDQMSNYTVTAEIYDTTATIRQDVNNESSSTINWSVTVQ